jgi:hypothetical protein
MKIVRWAGAAMAMTLALSILASPAMSQEIWLSPNGDNHYPELLNSAAPWPDAAEHVKVFKISNQFAVLASDAEFAAFIEGTKRLHLKIAMEGLMLTGTERCGHQVEGYSGPGAILRAAKRIKDAGGTLSYIVMDSVLIFGHAYTGTNACQDSIQSLAQQVAEKVAQAKSAFPDIQVGDIEPIGNPRAGWLQDIEAWAKAYRAATGQPLAFFDFDVDWGNPQWPQELQSGVALMRSLGIPIAVTYNGSKRETSSREWVSKAVEHFRRVEGDLNIRPRYAVIQSWNRYPEKMVPETDAETLSYVVREYSRTTAPN